MVQGTSHDRLSGRAPAHDYDKTAKKTGYEAMRKYQQENGKGGAEKKDPWGPVFKDKEHFGSLHHC